MYIIQFNYTKANYLLQNANINVFTLNYLYTFLSGRY